MKLSYNDVLSWSEVMKNYSKEMVLLVLWLECSWDHKDKAIGLFDDMKAGMLTYTPLKWNKYSDLQENKTRWHQLLKSVI